MDHLGRLLGVSSWQDWYAIGNQDFIDHDAHHILGHYNGSISKILQKVYPEHAWVEWKRSSGVSKNFWNIKSNQLEFFESIKIELNIKNFEDWYKVNLTITYYHYKNSFSSDISICIIIRNDHHILMTFCLGY